MDGLQTDRLVTAIEKLSSSFNRIANSMEEKNDIKEKFLNEETGDNSSIQE